VALVTTAPDLEAVWDALHEEVPQGWQTGRPQFREERNQWEMFAWDATQVTRPGRPRTRQWTAVATTEAGSFGKWPVA
jgi:hypothetical protein